MIKRMLYESIILPKYMNIYTPSNGFTRYLSQSKEGEIYMNGDMQTNFVFYENGNKVFKIFNDDVNERIKLYKEWDINISNKDKYICQNIEFIDEEKQEEIDFIFKNPTEELAIALQDIVDVFLKANSKYEIFIGVTHGEQLTEDGVRYPHVHLLLKKKSK